MNSALAITADPGTVPLLPTPRVEILGCAVDVVTLAEAVAAVERRIDADQPCQHMSINAAKLVRFQRERELRDAIERCELTTADGQAVVWAARMLGRPLPERVAGIDLMNAVAGRAAARGWNVFVLGGRAGVIDRALAALRERHPGLVVTGRHGYFDACDEADVVEQIAAADPHVLFVALETPAKELFLARNRDRLRIPFVMGIGGAVDVLAGARRRAPRVLQRTGLEWAFRLAQDPRRLARRYLVGNTRFAWLVARELVHRRPTA